MLLFEKIQKIRLESNPEDWQNENFLKSLRQIENRAKSEVLKMIKNNNLKTSDDFLRAGDIFHHGNTSSEYMLAAALNALSMHLGEPWAKNHYAVAIDRLFLSLGLPQYFGSQYIKRNGKWVLDKYNKKTADKERLKYTIEPLRLLKKRAEDIEKGITSREFLSED